VFEDPPFPSCFRQQHTSPAKTSDLHSPIADLKHPCALSVIDPGSGFRRMRRVPQDAYFRKNIHESESA
jgi:hypothetical protein